MTRPQPRRRRPDLRKRAECVARLDRRVCNLQIELGELSLMAFHDGDDRAVETCAELSERVEQWHRLLLQLSP